MAKKYGYTEKQLKPIRAKLKKLKTLQSKLDEIQDIKPNEVKKSNVRIGQRKLSKFDNKADAINYINRERKRVIDALRSSKIYKNVLAQKDKEQTSDVKSNGFQYFLIAFRFWERNQFIDYVVKQASFTHFNDIPFVRMDKIINEIERLLSLLTSREEIRLIKTASKKIYANIYNRGKNDSGKYTK